MENSSGQFILKDGREVTIREVRSDDAEAMIRFMNAIDCETRFLSREPGEFAMTLEEERNFIQARTEDARVHWIIAEAQGRIVASCSIFGAGRYKRYQHRATIGIVISRDYWGLGLGRRLMLENIARCRQIGYEQLELSVLAGNDRAIALYKSLGFEIQGTVTHAFKYADGTYADDYFMCLQL
jgi:RimJ/RimL family protein N-acetyltransferase